MILTPLEIIGILASAYFTVNFVLYLRSGDLSKDFWSLRVLRNGKWIIALLGTWFVLAVVVVVILLLYRTGIPLLRFSWLMLLATPAEAPSAGQNLVLSGVKIPGFMWIFLVLLALNVPRLAKNEERIFRQGVRDPKTAIWKSVQFGLVHCLIGVPLAAGIALIIPGLFWSWLYTKGGIRLTTAWHALHNWTLVAILALALAL